MEPLKIGNIILPHRAVFGPMAGFTDAPCRRLMAQHGAGFTVSEMVSSRATLRQSDTYRQGSGQSTGFRQRPPDAVSRHRIWLRHLRADMEYLPPDGGVPPSSDPPDGHGDAGFRAPGTA